jgi:lysophospholipase L1-like esterase
MRARILGLVALALPLGANLCDPTPFPADPNAAGHFAVALYGDSLTKAPGYAPWLDPAYYTIVRGSYGERGIEGAARFRADLPQKLTVTEQADVAVLMWGTNDVGWLNYVEHPKEIEGLIEQILGGPIPPGEDLESLPPGTTMEALLADWVARGVVTQAQADELNLDTESRTELVAAMALAALTSDRLAAFRSHLSSALSGFSPNVVRVVDLKPLFSGHPDPASLYTDGVHWTDAGKALAGGAIDAQVAAFAP